MKKHASHSKRFAGFEARAGRIARGAKRISAGRPAKPPTEARKPAKLPTGARRPAKPPTRARRPAKLPTGARKPAKPPTGARKPAKLPTGARKPAKLPTGARKPAKLPTGARKPAKPPPTGARRPVKAPDRSRALKYEVHGLVNLLHDYASADGAVNRDGTADVAATLPMSADLIGLQEKLDRFIPLLTLQWWIRIGFQVTAIEGEEYFGPSDTNLEIFGYETKYTAWRPLRSYARAFVAASGFLKKLFENYEASLILIELHASDEAPKR